MKKVLFIPALCLLCASCGGNTGKTMGDKSDYSNGANQMQSQPTDMEITANVKQMIMDDSSLSSSAKMISVTTNNGVVTLTGKVESKAESYKVVNMVQDMSGVTRVDNQLMVTRP